MRSVAFRRDRGHGFNDMRSVGFPNVRLSHKRYGPHAVLPRQRFAATVSDAVRRQSDSDRFQLLQVQYKKKNERDSRFCAAHTLPGQYFQVFAVHGRLHELSPPGIRHCPYGPETSARLQRGRQLRHTPLGTAERLGGHRDALQRVLPAGRRRVRFRGERALSVYFGTFETEHVVRSVRGSRQRPRCRRAFAEGRFFDQKPGIFFLVFFFFFSLSQLTFSAEKPTRGRKCTVVRRSNKMSEKDCVDIFLYFLFKSIRIRGSYFK